MTISVAGTPSTEAALATREPPASFSAFKLEPIVPEPGPDHVNNAFFAVRCKTCGEDDFHFGSFPAVAPDPSPQYGVEPGGIWRRPPHRLRCAHCGATGSIFDTRTDGYDGILNGGGPYDSGSTGEVFGDAPAKVEVFATYNILLDELKELAAAAGQGVKPTDLFDWFNIVVTPNDGSKPFELDYECA
jgi:hypothetical protein